MSPPPMPAGGDPGRRGQTGRQARPGHGQPGEEARHDGYREAGPDSAPDEAPPAVRRRSSGTAGQYFVR